MFGADDAKDANMAESLKDKTVKGVGWNLGGSMASYGITFLVGIVLARLLSPEEYGLIGIIMIFVTVFDGIIDSGFSNALIRKKDADEADNNTMFITNLVFSVVLFFVMFLGAPLIARFFGHDILVPLTRVMSCYLVINAFCLIQRALLVREIDFKTITKCQFISAGLSGIVGVSMALAGCGVWSLVGQNLSRIFFNTLCLWIFRNWKPSFSFSWDSFRDLFGFGWKLMVSGIINSVWGQLYQVVIGKCYSTETLGQYTKAREYVDIVSKYLTSVVQQVSYPALSQIQDEKERLKGGYRRVIKLTMLVVFILVLGMAACAKQLILVLIGEKWLPCVPIMQIVCFSMSLYPLHAINLNMLQVQGRSDLFLKLEIVKKVIGILPILAGIFFNIYWMLIVGFVTGGCIDFILNSYYSGRFVGYSTKDQLMDILPSLWVALAVALPVFGLSFLPLNPFILLPVQLIVGAAIAFLLLERTRLEEYQELKQIAIPIVNRVIKRHG